MNEEETTAAPETPEATAPPVESEATEADALAVSLAPEWSYPTYEMEEINPIPKDLDPRITVRPANSNPPHLGDQAQLLFDPELHGLPADSKIEDFVKDPTRANHWTDTRSGNTYHLHADFPYWRGANGRAGVTQTLPAARPTDKLEYVIAAPDGAEIICPTPELAKHLLDLLGPRQIEAPFVGVALTASGAIEAGNAVSLTADGSVKAMATGFTPLDSVALQMPTIISTMLDEDGNEVEVTHSADVEPPAIGYVYRAGGQRCLVTASATTGRVTVHPPLEIVLDEAENIPAEVFAQLTLRASATTDNGDGTFTHAFTPPDAPATPAPAVFTLPADDSMATTTLAAEDAAVQAARDASDNLPLQPGAPGNE